MIFDNTERLILGVALAWPTWGLWPRGGASRA
jgi:hypothetical protein